MFRAAPALWIVVVVTGITVGAGLVMIGLNGGAWPTLLAQAVGRPDLAGVPLSGLPQGVVMIPDLDGQPVILDPSPLEVEPAAGAWDDRRQAATRFRAPAQGLDVPLLRMNVRGGVINPPTLRDAFEVVALEPDLPRVIALHAVRGGRAAGNAFYAQHPTGTVITVAAGDVLHVGERTYVVDDVTVLDQQDAARSERIWGASPDQAGRLVVITCLQRPGLTGPAEENLVIFAHHA